MQEKSTTFIGAFDLSKFSMGQLKKQPQNSNSLEHRAMIQSRSTSLEISFIYTFSSQTLITQIDIDCYSQEEFFNVFENIDVEINSLTNRGHYTQPLNYKITKDEQKITYHGVAVTHSVKLSLLLKNDIKKKNSRNQRQLQENVKKLLSQTLQEINIFGITINSNPGPVHLTKLLNFSQNFKKYSLHHQATQTNILIALSLINSRRFVQAAEMLKKVSKFYLEKYITSKSSMDLNRSEKSWVKDFDEDILGSSLKNNFTSGRVLEGNKFLQKAAKIELLLAQTISHPSFIIEKLQAYHRSNCFANGNASPGSLRLDADLEEVTSSISPQFIPFLLRVLSDRQEPFRIAALKSIQFILETLGCSIGSFFAQIVHEVIITYPNNIISEIDSARIPYGLSNFSMENKSEKINENSISVIGKNKILIDHYHHLLQTLLTIIVQANKKIIQNLFSEIISPSLLNKNLGTQLKLYLLRFAEKILTIVGPDLQVEVSFLGYILEVCEIEKSNQFSSKNKSNRPMKASKGDHIGNGTSKHVMYNLLYFSHKILTLLKGKIYNNYSGNRLEPVLEWVNKTLAYLCDNELLSTNSSHLFFLFNTILDFIYLIYSTNTHKMDHTKLIQNPIEPILYFTNNSIHQTGLPFEKILNCLTILVNYLVSINPNCEIGRDIVSRIMQKSKQHNLVLKELKILVKIIHVINCDTVEWLDIFLDCIPHSTFDQTYEVFNILFKKSIPQLKKYNEKEKSRLFKKVVKILFDQYTVKGKAYQETKENLISSLLDHSPQLIIEFLKICLFENIQPHQDAFYSKRKLKNHPFINKQLQNDKEHRFDSKMFKIQQQLFMDKITFVQLIMTKIQNEFILNDIQVLVKFCSSLQRIATSHSWKAKNKVLNIFKYLIEIIDRQGEKQKKFSVLLFTIVIKSLFSISKGLLAQQSHRQSKMMYNVLYNIMNMYRCLNDQNFLSKQINDEAIEAQAQNILTISEGLLAKKQIVNSDVASMNNQKVINFIKMKEFIKIWNSIYGLYNSPWECVKDLFILTILETFKNGLSSVPQNLVKRSLDMLKPLLYNFLTSPQYTQRLNGVKIFGCLLGLRSSENKEQKLSEIISQNMRYLRMFVDKVYELQQDWNQTISEISQSICEICLTKQSRQNIKRKLLDRKTQNSMIQSSFCTFNLGEEFNFEKKQYSLLSNTNNFDNFLKDSIHIDTEEGHVEELHQKLQITEDLIGKIVLFRNLIDKDIQTRTQNYWEKESFIEQQNEEQLYEIGDERAESIDGKDNKSEEQQLEFEDLGIIELDDEEWGEQQEKQVRITQKLPLKKIYKLSPSVVGTKPQRIRSKRFHQNEFDYHENIIVDELEENIQIKRQKQKEEPLPESCPELMVKDISEIEEEKYIFEEKQSPFHRPKVETLEAEKVEKLPSEEKKETNSEKQIWASGRKPKKSLGKKRKPSNGK